MTLPLFRRRRLREDDRKGAAAGSRPRPGLSKDLEDGARMAAAAADDDEEDGAAAEGREPKQKNRSPPRLRRWE